MACLVPKAVDWAELIGRVASTRTPFSTVEDFAQSLTRPTKLADLCVTWPVRIVVSFRCWRLRHHDNAHVSQ